MQQTTDTAAEYWAEREAARRTGLAAITLKVWRLKGKPIATVYKFGRRVMYRAADVRAWAESCRQAA